MRKDMGRVVTERPRRGSSNPSLKMREVGLFRLDADDWTDWEFDGPVRVPSSGNGMNKFSPKIEDKSFSDVLGPIRGYLMSQRGRPWDKVFSDVSRVLGRGSYPIQHVLYDHLLNDVEYRCYEENGRIYSRSGRRSRFYADREVDGFYVDPRSGLLCWKPESWRRRYTPPAEQWDTDRFQIPGTNRWFVAINGIWFIGTYRKTSMVCLDRREYPNGRVEKYGQLAWPDYQIGWGPNAGACLFTKIKQASKKELRRLRELARS